MRARTTMTDMATVYRRPVGVMRQSVKPQLASWERAGHPSQVKLGRFLAHVDAIAGPVLATVRGRVAAELPMGFSDDVSLGRKIHGPSSLALGPAQPGTAGMPRSSRPG